MDTKLLFQKITEENKTQLPFSLNYHWWNEVVLNNWDVAVVTDGSQVLAAWPYYLRKRGPWVFVTNPHFTPYAGPIINYPPDQKNDTRISYENKIIQRLIDQFPDFDEFTQNLPPNFNNTLQLLFNNFQDTKRYTYILDLSKSEEEIWQGFRENIRRQIRKATKNIVIESTQESRLIESLLKESFEGQSTDYPKVESAYFDRMVYFVQKYNCGAVWKATQDGVADSVLYLVHDQTTAYYLVGGSSKNSKSSGAMSLLLWNAIQWAKEKELQFFNFEGSSIAPIEKFLRGFGGALTPFSHLSKSNSKSLQLAKKIKR